MAGPKNQQIEAAIMQNSDSKLRKKHKNKQKRKIEETDAEDVEIDKNAEEGVLDASSTEISKKKKKKAKGNCKEEISLNGSGEESIKKDKKKNKNKEGDGVSEVKIAETAQDEVIEGSGVVVSGKNVNESKYKALDSFSESGLPDEVLECCKAFDKPSPIQSHSWPFLLDGRDLIGIAAMRFGKMLAFGVPAIRHVLNKRKSNAFKKVYPRCLVLSLTRELAQQISDVLCLITEARSRVADAYGLRSGATNGGVGLGKSEATSQTSSGMRSSMSRTDSENSSILHERREHPNGQEKERVNLKAVNKYGNTFV